MTRPTGRPAGGPRCGERNGRAKLTLPIVRELRGWKSRSPGLEAWQAAGWLRDEHGIELSLDAIYLVWNRRTWRGG